MKKLLLASALILSTSTFANLSAKLNVPYDTIHTNWDQRLSSDHSFTITNTTSSVQNVTACYEITMCPEYDNYKRTTRNCQSFDLQPGQSKSDHNYAEIIVNYPFRGNCKLYAQTDVIGYPSVKDEKVMQVKND